MNDLIDRQLAIDAMENVDWYHINKDGQLIHGANSEEDEPLYKAEDIYNVLEQLPSAEPELIEREAYIRGFEQGKTQGRLDALSAQPEMIREIRKWINSGNRGNADYFIVEKIEEIINKYE